MVPSDTMAMAIIGTVGMLLYGRDDLCNGSYSERAAHGSCSVEWQTTDDDSGLMGELELLHLPKGT